MRRKRIILILLAILLPLGLRAQEKTITVTGTVLDDAKLPVIGAAVIPGGDLSKGVVTDIDGIFVITVPEGTELTVTCLGYANQVIKANEEEITVVMHTDVNMLEETVVIGYGSVKKSDLTGSVVNVKLGEVLESPAVAVDNALQGRIAGAEFMSTDGAPGATTTIRIRGSRSITASNEPLFVVDGVMDAINDLNDINSNDIASISVLKDASSTAIYGSRGANGVIIITTKQGGGDEGKPNVTFKSDVGVSWLRGKLDIMNATEFALYRNDYSYFSNDTRPQSSLTYSDPFSLEGTDWIKEMTRVAVTQNYALSISGKGSKKSSYYVSLSYNDTPGIIQGSGQQRFTGRISVDREFYPWLKLGYTGSYTYRLQDVARASIGGTSYRQAAMYLSPFIAPGDYNNPLVDGNNDNRRINTPRAAIDLITNLKEFHSSNHSFKADIKPMEDLLIKSTFSYFLFQRHHYKYSPGALPAKNESDGGEAYRDEYNTWSLSSETTATYTFRNLGDHSLNLMGGISAYKSAKKDFNLQGSGYMDDAVMWNNMNAVLDKDTYTAETSYSSKTKMSFFGRFDYNWKSRYYLTATLRYDGASNFAENHKWAPFPSAAFRWNATNEEFLKGVSWLDDLSVRLSAGLTGNDAISEYRSLAALGTTTDGYVFDGSQPVAYYRSRLASPNLTWEKTAMYNAAVDVSLLKGNVNVTAEAYYSRTTDLLLTVQLASQTGYSSRYANVGTTSNRGFELSVETHNINKKNFGWSTTLSLSHNKQLVEDVGSEEFVSAYNSPGNNSFMMYGYVAGYPLNSLWGFRYGGVWHSEEELLINDATHTYAGIGGNARVLGYPRYYDINHDGALNQDDLVYQGSADPWLFGGIQNTFHIYGVKLGVFLAYSLGGKIYNYSEFYMAGSRRANQYRYMLNSWHPERNPESNLPRAGVISDQALPSDFMIYDASFLRLKTLSVAYTFDLKDKSKRLKDLTLSLVGDNLILLKNYNGFDPDVSSEGTSSTLRRADIDTYPKSASIVLGAQVRF
ncbi:MAG: TonB-dependent receptor [Bacteroidales bacterium]|nr:TonB-dependent receptor [Bacteroidales bacterium]